MLLSENSIQQIRKSDLVNVIGKYVKLKKRGNNYIGLCPFHNERTPSFNVTPGKGFYCFGCETKGRNAIDFIMLYEKKSFVDATIHLANFSNINLLEVAEVNQQKKVKWEPKVEKVDFLPKGISEKSLQHWNENNFTEWLISLFGFEETEKNCKLFNIGSSKHWKHSTMFWQVDLTGNLRQATIILYNSENGKRVKKGSFVEKWNYLINGFESGITNSDCVKVYGKFLSKETQKLNLFQCFFGEDQINKFPGKKIGIVESQKTAVLLTFFYPEYIWLATGGKNGCKWTDLQVCIVLENREVVLFPDKGIDCFNLWRERGDEIKSKVNCKIIVSDILENSEIANEIEPGEDLADYFMQQLQKPF